jgi:hypothetical protein
MIPLRRILVCLAWATAFGSFPLSAQTAANAATPARIKSPVAEFRELLAMTPAERKQAISIRPPEIQERILQKLGEYQILPDELREQRLRETELRWYLRPLMDEPRTNRAARLALIPDDERQLVEQRLEMWDLLPPSLQEEMKNNDMVVNYLAQSGTATPEERDDILKKLPPDRRAELEKGLDRWQQMSDDQRQKALAGFNRIFQLTPEEREKTLDTVSDEERQQMEQTLQAYGKLTQAQRAQCIRSFGKFATMSVAERQQFLKNAEQWNKMTPEERQKWRELVTVAPIMPGAGNSAIPRLPSHTIRLSAPVKAPMVATN